MFVAHSFGGVLVKRALCMARESDKYERRSIFSSTKALIFLGTPHHGTGSAWFADIFAKLCNIMLGSQNEPRITQVSLARTTASILTVQRAFEATLHEKGVQINITSFYEELPVPGVGLVRLCFTSLCTNMSDIFPGGHKKVGEAQWVSIFPSSR
jgi:hypothetical protein